MKENIKINKEILNKKTQNSVYIYILLILLKLGIQIINTFYHENFYYEKPRFIILIILDLVYFLSIKIKILNIFFITGQIKRIILVFLGYLYILSELKKCVLLKNNKISNKEHETILSYSILFVFLYVLSLNTWLFMIKIMSRVLYK